MATKKIDKELKKHIEEAMNKKREVSHAIVSKEPREKQLKMDEHLCKPCYFLISILVVLEDN